MAASPPQHPQHHQPTPISPDTAKLLDSIVQTAKECDMLRTDKAALEVMLDDSRREASYYKDLAEKERQEKDFYMRHSTALVTQLNSIGHLLAQTIDSAKREALRQPQQAQPVQHEPETDPETERLGAKFGADNR